MGQGEAASIGLSGGVSVMVTFYTVFKPALFLGALSVVRQSWGRLSCGLLSVTARGDFVLLGGGGDSWSGGSLGDWDGNSVLLGSFVFQEGSPWASARVG